MAHLAKTLAIIGAGGLGKEVVDIIRSSPQETEWELVFIDDLVPVGTIVNDVPVIGSRALLDELSPARTDICVAVGMPTVRRELIKNVEGRGFSFATIIDSSALIRRSSVLGTGVIVGARSFVSCDSIIGAHAVINPGVFVGHDVVIGPYVVLGGGVLLSGGVRIGEGTLVGAGASVLLNTPVGEWATVAMGAAVLAPVGDGATVVGNPARTLPVVRRNPESAVTKG
jgi:sugar O-acyltransferase (sialic acid O-acetyltransferase NeuD family)